LRERERERERDFLEFQSFLEFFKSLIYFKQSTNEQKKRVVFLRRAVTLGERYRRFSEKKMVVKII